MKVKRQNQLLADLTHFIKNYIYPHKGKRMFGIAGQRWQENVKMDLKELEWEGLAACMWLEKGTRDKGQWTRDKGQGLV